MGFRSAGSTGFVDGHTLSEILTILGGRAVRMFLPGFDVSPADNELVTDMGPRGHHFLKHGDEIYPPYIKGHVLVNRWNGAGMIGEAWDMMDHPDFSMGADGTADNEPAFTVGIATRFRAVDFNAFPCRYDSTGLAEEVEWRFYTEGTGLLEFSLYDAAVAVTIGQRYSVPLVVDRWYILFGVYDGSCANTGIKLYVDGVQVDDTPLAAGGYTAMHNTSVATTVGYAVNPAGGLGYWMNGDIWGPFITKKCLSDMPPSPGAQSEIVRLTNLYRRVLCL